MNYFFFRQANDYNQEYGKKSRLYINNFGYYLNITKDIKINRANGRKDYHLLYVANGEILVNETKMKNGDFYIYLPDEAQSYTYRGSQNCLYYWVHFTGNMLSDIIHKNHLSGEVHSNREKQSDAESIFRMIANELSHNDNEPSIYAVSLFYSLLVLLSQPPKIKYPFSRAIKILEDITQNVNINSIAGIYNMSPAHFIRSFKKVYDTTPLDYKNRHKISFAKNLLIDTELSVADIAEQCGIDDQFYFSRIFKKQTGMSPTNYRNVNRKNY